MNYTATAPCANCPFRSDRPFPLVRGRVRQIQGSLIRSEFACHKTTETNDETGDTFDTENSVHCAGALILLEKIRRPSQMMRICERIGLYDPSKLQMDAPVYDSWEEMENGCSIKNVDRKPETVNSDNSAP